MSTGTRTATSAWAVARHLLAIYRVAAVIVWLISAAAMSMIVYVATRRFSPGLQLEDVANLWRWTSLTGDRYFLLIVAIIVAAAQLRGYVASGVTRRDAVWGSIAFFGSLAVTFAVLAAGYAAAVLAVLDASGTSVDTVGSGPVRFGLALLGYLACACTGLLIGLGFIRFGAWRGIAFLPVAIMPTVLAEIVASAPSTPVVLGTVAAVLVGVWLTGRVAHGVVVRHSPAS